MSHTLHILPLSLFCLILLAASPLPAQAETTNKEAAAPVAVAVAKVSEQDVPVLIEVAGTLQAAERSSIAAMVRESIRLAPVLRPSRRGGHRGTSCSRPSPA